MPKNEDVKRKRRERTDKERVLADHKHIVTARLLARGAAAVGSMVWTNPLEISRCDFFLSLVTRFPSVALDCISMLGHN